MRLYLPFLSLCLAAFAAPSPALAVDHCRMDPERALTELRNPHSAPELRANSGACLVRRHLDRSDVVRAVSRIISDEQEDVLLREDLVDALAEAPWRKRIKVEGNLGPILGAQDKHAIDHTVPGAGGLLAVVGAVKEMDEVVPTTRLEGELFRGLADLAESSATPVLLRAAAVAALEKATARVVASGVYEEKSVRLAQDTLRTLVVRSEDESYFTGAGEAYGRLASAGTPYFAVPNRSLASQPATQSRRP